MVLKTAHLIDLLINDDFCSDVLGVDLTFCGWETKIFLTKVGNRNT
jgi:hypothetical protein